MNVATLNVAHNGNRREEDGSFPLGEFVRFYSTTINIIVVYVSYGILYNI